MTPCVFCWAVFPCVVFFAAAPLARFRLPLLRSRCGGPLRLALFARFPRALWLIGVVSFLCVLYQLWLFTADHLLVCSGISNARRLSIALSKFGTGLSLNNLSRPPSSVVPITIRSRMSESLSVPNSHESAIWRRRTTYSSIVSPGFCNAELNTKRLYNTLRWG